MEKGSTTSNISIYINGKLKGETTITNSVNTVIDIQAIQITGVTKSMGIQSVFIEQSKGDI